MTKLKAYMGITGKLLNWIHSFLQRYVESKETINGFKSTWMDVISDVPQGSVLECVLLMVHFHSIVGGKLASLFN